MNNYKYGLEDKGVFNIVQYFHLGTLESKMDERYSQAMEALKNLNMNCSGPQNRGTPQNTAHFLLQSGISSNELDQLGVIHISGTKGKGSTCAFSESILRQRGLKTGLFTSPHLLSVTERIRINGDPISKAMFSDYFWEVYDKVVTAHPEQDLPVIFHFLTVLAYHIFVRENVDVAIIEGKDFSNELQALQRITLAVGIGGRYDSTNLVRKPVVCGITTLDIDHTQILGETIEQIAWHKAGIMKPGTATFIDGCQSEVLRMIFKVRFFL